MTGGLDPAGLDALAAAVGRHVGPDAVPGLVALVARGDDVHVETAGVLALDGPPVRLGAPSPFDRAVGRRRPARRRRPGGGAGGAGRRDGATPGAVEAGAVEVRRLPG